MKSLKVIIVTFLAVFSLSTTAQEMPKYLKGATVTVKLKNGKTYTYKSEDMAVVKRDKLTVNSGILARHIEVETKIKNKKLVKNRKNRVYVLAGYGQTGDMEISSNGSKYEVKHKKGSVGGLGYQRKLSEKVNVGIQVQSNQTTSLSLGLDF